MTTQVVLMNGLGIALASDSAVTSGGKVLNTSEKVFDLPVPHKIALLTSGRADFMGHPWEVLFSAWATNLDKPLASLIDYRESLYKFIRTILPSTGDQSRPEADYIRESYLGEGNVLSVTNDLLSNILIPFFENILTEEDRVAFMDNSQWDEDFRQRMTSLLTDDVQQEFLDSLGVAIQDRKEWFTPADTVSTAQARVWVDKYWSQRETEPSETDFAFWPKIKNFDETVKEFWSTSIVYADPAGDSYVALVGYGASDLFPSAAGVYFHGVLSGTIIKRAEGDLESSPEPRHVFLGQDDAITRLTGGEDRLLTTTAVQASRKTLSEIYDQLSSSTEESAKQAREYVKESMEKDDLADEIKRAGNEKRQKPFTRAISMSPIIDLAEFAAQLVGVQAASAAMTQENPSVGGFVDVAIITHRRGFEWIRHKQ
jgi:hypothetical protein